MAEGRQAAVVKRDRKGREVEVLGERETVEGEKRWKGETKLEGRRVERSIKEKKDGGRRVDVDEGREYKGGGGRVGGRSEG